MRRIMAFPPERRDVQPVGILDPDLGVRQVAGRVLGPGIAGHLQRADAGVAAADRLKGTGAAAALQRPRPRAQRPPASGRRRSTARERRLPSPTADRVVGPVGVGMHLALRVDVGHAQARWNCRPRPPDAPAPAAASRRRNSASTQARKYTASASLLPVTISSGRPADTRAPGPVDQQVHRRAGAGVARCPRRGACRRARHRPDARDRTCPPPRRRTDPALRAASRRCPRSG